MTVGGVHTDLEFLISSKAREAVRREDILIIDYGAIKDSRWRHGRWCQRLVDRLPMSTLRRGDCLLSSTATSSRVSRQTEYHGARLAS